MQTERKNITQPAAWWAIFEAVAEAEGLSLSEWVGDCCLANVPAAKRKGLPERITRGRPTHKKVTKPEKL